MPLIKAGYNFKYFKRKANFHQSSCQEIEFLNHRFTRKTILKRKYLFPLD